MRANSANSDLQTLAAEHISKLRLANLDINDHDQISSLADKTPSGSFDVLFLNAGISKGPDETSATIGRTAFVELLITNALSPLLVVERFHDKVVKDGTIAVMSSDLASIENNHDGGWEVYRASKAALNTLMRSFSARQIDNSRTYLAVSPGWVRTDMGGPTLRSMLIRACKEFFRCLKRDEAVEA